MRITQRISNSAIAIALGLAAGGAALAQTPAPADPHHPGPASTVPPPAATSPPPSVAPGPGMPGQGRMPMGGDMGRMMQMMPGMMGGPPGGVAGAARMNPLHRIEGRLAFVRAELAITEAQAPQWTAFAAIVRTQAERMRQEVMRAMQAASQPASAPQQIERRIMLLASQLEAMRAVAAAAGPLYAALSEEQRRTADELLAEHFQAMRMGMI